MRAKGSRASLPVFMSILHKPFVLIGVNLHNHSTLIHTLTNSRSEVAPYEFTTLHPQIGTLIIYTDGTWDTGDQSMPIQDSPAVQDHHDQYSATQKLQARMPTGGEVKSKTESTRLTIADCPGLIPKASMNVGLGHAFLRHIERSRTLVVVIDILAGLPNVPVNQDSSRLDQTSSSTVTGKKPEEKEVDLERPCRDVELLMKELEDYQPGLSGRVKVIVANKADLSTHSHQLKQITQTRIKLLEAYLSIFRQHQIESGICQSDESSTIEVVVMSAKHRQNVPKLVRLLKSHAQQT